MPTQNAHRKGVLHLWLGSIKKNAQFRTDSAVMVGYTPLPLFFFNSTLADGACTSAASNNIPKTLFRLVLSDCANWSSFARCAPVIRTPVFTNILSSITPPFVENNV
jgi:hypothetical protein